MSVLRNSHESILFLSTLKWSFNILYIFCIFFNLKYTFIFININIFKLYLQIFTKILFKNTLKYTKLHTNNNESVVHYWKYAASLLQCVPDSSVGSLKCLKGA